jgi:hypothetical protein
MGMNSKINLKEKKTEFFVLFIRVVKTCRDRVTKQEYAVKVC